MNATARSNIDDAIFQAISTDNKLILLLTCILRKQHGTIQVDLESTNSRTLAATTTLLISILIYHSDMPNKLSLHRFHHATCLNME